MYVRFFGIVFWCLASIRHSVTLGAPARAHLGLAKYNTSCVFVCKDYVLSLSTFYLSWHILNTSLRSFPISLGVLFCCVSFHTLDTSLPQCQLISTSTSCFIFTLILPLSSILNYNRPVMAGPQLSDPNYMFKVWWKVFLMIRLAECSNADQKSKPCLLKRACSRCPPPMVSSRAEPKLGERGKGYNEWMRWSHKWGEKQYAILEDDDQDTGDELRINATSRDDEPKPKNKTHT